MYCYLISLLSKGGRNTILHISHFSKSNSIKHSRSNAINRVYYKNNGRACKRCDWYNNTWTAARQRLIKISSIGKNVFGYVKWMTWWSHQWLWVLKRACPHGEVDFGSLTFNSPSACMWRCSVSKISLSKVRSSGVEFGLSLRFKVYLFNLFKEVSKWAMWTICENKCYLDFFAPQSHHNQENFHSQTDGEKLLVLSFKIL